MSSFYTIGQENIMSFFRLRQVSEKRKTLILNTISGLGRITYPEWKISTKKFSIGIEKECTWCDSRLLLFTSFSSKLGKGIIPSELIWIILKTSLSMGIDKIVQSDRSCRDLNSDRWIQSPKCLPLHHRTCQLSTFNIDQYLACISGKKKISIEKVCI